MSYSLLLLIKSLVDFTRHSLYLFIPFSMQLMLLSYCLFPSYPNICSRNKYLFLIKLRYKEKDQIIRPLYNRLDRQLKCINDKINANI